MDKTPTFTLPVNTRLHARAQHAKSTSRPSPSNSRSSSRLFEKLGSPADKKASVPTNTINRGDTSTKHDHDPTHDDLGIYDQITGESRTSGVVGSMGGKTRVRPRGESDLGRPVPINAPRGSPSINGFAFSPIAEHPSTPKHGFVLQYQHLHSTCLLTIDICSHHISTSNSLYAELLTGVLIPLPFLLASLAYPLQNTYASPLESTGGIPNEHHEKVKDGIPAMGLPAVAASASLVQACSLAAASLLLVGILARLYIPSNQSLDRRKDASTGMSMGNLFTPMTASRVLVRSMCVALPYYATMQLGGIQTGLIILLSVASGMVGLAAIQERKFTSAIMAICVLLDLVGLTSSSTGTDLLMGYLALSASAFALPLSNFPLVQIGSSHPSKSSKGSTSAVPTPPMSPRFGLAPATASAFSREEADITLLGGAVLAAITFVISFLLPTAAGLSLSAILFSLGSVASMIGLFFFSRPLTLRSSSKSGVAAGSAFIAISGCLYHFGSWRVPLVFTVLSALGYCAALFDDRASSIASSTPRKQHTHHHHSHDQHKHDHPSIKYSKLTGALLKFCTPGSIVDTVMRERDTRRIAYFGW
jgi:zinc transporter 5/7